MAVAVLCAIVACYLFGGTDGSLAQTEIPFSTAKVASSDSVVAGQELTYLITLKNVSDVPQKDVWVLDNLPDEVEFQYATSQESGVWAYGSINDDRTAFWVSLNPVPPDVEFELKVVVRVKESAEGPLINGDYGVGLGEPVIELEGEPVVVNVIRPTSTPVPTPTRTGTPTPNLTPTRTATAAVASPTPLLPSPALTPVEATATESPTPTPTVPVENTRVTRSPLLLGVIAGSGATVFVGIAFAIRRLGRKRG